MRMRIERGEAADEYLFEAFGQRFTITAQNLMDAIDQVLAFLTENYARYGVQRN